MPDRLVTISELQDSSRLEISNIDSYTALHTPLLTILSSLIDGGMYEPAATF